MFTNSVVQPVDSGTIHLHSDTSAFATTFPSQLLDDAFEFALKQQQKAHTNNATNKSTTTTVIATTTQIAVQLSDDSLPFAVRLIQELQERETNRRRRQQEKQLTTSSSFSANENQNDDEEKNSVEKQHHLNFFILADNTFAPCCADQVTAQRNNADAIIHFGQTCFSQSIDSIPCAFFVPPWSLNQASNNSNTKNNSTLVITQIAKIFTEQKIAQLIKTDTNAIESIVFIFSAGINKSDFDAFKNEVSSSLLLLSASDNNDSLDSSTSTTNKILTTFTICGTKTHELGLSSSNTSAEWNVDGATFPIAQKSGRQILFFISPSLASSLQKSDDDSDKPQNSPLHQLALIEYWNSARRIKFDEENQEESSSSSSNSSSSSTVITNWFHHFTPSANTPRSLATIAKDVARRVNQRMRNIEALSNADSVGLLVMSLSISEHRNLLTKLQTLLRSGGKRVYVVFIGHLNEYKLANFVDSIDVFVSLACPNSRPAFFASKEDNFNVPLLFPAEVTLWYERDVKNIPEERVGAAFLSPELFTTRARKSLSHIRIVDDGKTTRRASNDDDDEGGESNNNQRRGEQHDDQTSGTLIVRAPMHIATTSTTKGTLTKFQEKSYHGLDPRYGQDSVQTDMIDGLSGIAKGYDQQYKGDDSAVRK